MTDAADDWATGIEWDRWEQSPVITHIDQSCDKCLFAGPLLHRWGTTLQGTPTRRRRLRTHWAVRCQSCGEEIVYYAESIASGELTEVAELYRSPDFDLAKHARLRQPTLFDTMERHK